MRPHRRPRPNRPLTFAMRLPQSLIYAAQYELARQAERKALKRAQKAISRTKAALGT